MYPEIPISSIIFHTQLGSPSPILQRVALYRKRLEKLEILNLQNQEFEGAFMELIHQCENLKELHVTCKLSKENLNILLKKKKLKIWTFDTFS